MAYVCYSQLTKARNQQQKLKKKKKSKQLEIKNTIYGSKNKLQWKQENIFKTF